MALSTTRAGIKAQFGQTLTKLMNDRGWNQSELARKAQLLAPKSLSMTRDKVSKWSRGQVIPNAAHLSVLAATLEVEPTELLPSRLALSEQVEPRLSIEDQGNGTVLLRINQTVPFETALEVMRLLKGD